MQARRRARTTPPYTALAAGYDVVMAHVEYDLWAAYVHGLFRAHRRRLRSVLELGCGTGSLALALQPLGAYRYTATDGSPAMIRVARAKAAQANSPVRFDVADFVDFRVDEPFEAVLLVYDGLNYLLEEEQVRALFQGAYDAVVPGGLFVLDQSTPANSINNAVYFEDEGRVGDFAYVRRSRYDEAASLHTTTFTLTVDGEQFYEQHVQRAYTLDEIRGLARAARFEIAAAYDDFTTNPATNDSERIHWVLRRPDE